MAELKCAVPLVKSPGTMMDDSMPNGCSSRERVWARESWAALAANFVRQ